LERRSYVPLLDLTAIMRSPSLVSGKIFMIASLLAVGTMNLVPFSQAQELESELVPEPWVHETHEYNVSGEVDGTPTDEFFVNEKWSIEVAHGDVMTLIMARNITQNGTASVDYTNNIHYSIGGKLYIAQFMIMELVFKIGGYGIHAPLGTCSGFELDYSPIRYDGTVPTFDCNITYEGIRVYSVGSFPVVSNVSTVDLTLLHHIRGDWNNTHIKIEALLDFANARFYNPDDSNNEFNAGEPFTAEVGYMMMLANPEDFRTIGPVIPSGYTNTTLEYNMTLDNGSPVTVSQLEMRDSFTIYNGSSARVSIGYSSMELHGGQAYVTHGFPNLTYMDTQSMKSDPEITVYHDLVTADDPNVNQTLKWGLIATIGVIGVAGAMGTVLFLRKRQAR